jgi:hypothetical protein
MNTAVILVVSLVCGTSGALLAQTSTPAAAPAASMSTKAPVPAVQRKPGQKNRQRVISHTPDQPGTPVPQKHTGRRAAPHPNSVQHPNVTFAQARTRQHHERHDRRWWTGHYRTIVFVNGCGYYYWDAGYWFPAYGYDPQNESYDYDGPIYTYGDLLPDQVIYNVQRALKDLGYYEGALTGSLSQSSRAAIAAFQQDNGLDVTGAIDAPTVEALGLD